MCDLACLVSRGTISGTGLSKARLLNLRYAAIRYHRGSYIPQYLMAAMVEFARRQGSGRILCESNQVMEGRRGRGVGRT